MEIKVSFFEVPAADLGRAILFYENVFDCKLDLHECETESMAFFPEVNGICPGAVSFAEGFRSGRDGLLVHFGTADLDGTISRITAARGTVITPKTAIDGGKGYFAVCLDTEGNRFGLYAKN